MGSKNNNIRFIKNHHHHNMGYTARSSTSLKQWLFSLKILMVLQLLISNQQCFIPDIDEDLLVVYYTISALDEHEKYRSFKKNPINPYIYMDDTQFRHNFRFTKDEFGSLLAAMSFPAYINVHGVGTVQGCIVLLKVLYRLHFPVRFIDFEPTFGYSYQESCKISNMGIKLVYGMCKNKIDFDI